MTQEQRWYEAAKRYAAAERSDPFALRRALTHMSLRTYGFTNKGEEAIYDAEQHTEERFLPDGRVYTVPVYRNVKRP